MKIDKITLDDFYKIVVEKENVELSDEAIDRIKKSRLVVDDIIKGDRVIYGVNSGFGSLKDKKINKEDLELLQLNLIRSHAVGIGDPSSIEVVRGMLLLRLVCICNGNSGVRLVIAEKLVEALNKNYIPLVPQQGTVGASGDLAPLSHMVLGLLGEGKAFDGEKYVDAKVVMKKLDIEPIKLQAKEGLALNNGTQFICANLALACYHSERIMKLCNIIASFTVEVLHGTLNAFDDRIHKAKGHLGQIICAREILKYLLPKSESCKKYSETKVQDAYSLRCIPQIHGISYDIIMEVKKIVENEMNSSNDNPLIFDNDIISGGNFHGCYVSIAADQLCIAMSNLCNISERRLDRILNKDSNGFMPSFLSRNAGLNSGLMITQYASAGITAENRQLANPSSIHNIPTCENYEDVVSMGGHSSRKAYTSVMNTYKVLVYELYAAYQAKPFTKERMAEKIEELVKTIEKNVKISHLNDDFYMKDEIDGLLEFIKKNTF